MPETDLESNRKFWGSNALATVNYLSAGGFFYLNSFELQSEPTALRIGLGALAVGALLRGIHYTAQSKSHYNKLTDKKTVLPL
jgi:hypothetical protein